MYHSIITVDGRTFLGFGYNPEEAQENVASLINKELGLFGLVAVIKSTLPIAFGNKS